MYLQAKTKPFTHNNMTVISHTLKRMNNNEKKIAKFLNLLFKEAN